MKEKSCLSVYSYIKPQLRLAWVCLQRGCLSVYSYIKPQLTHLPLLLRECCLSVYSYIKPQLLLNKLIVPYSCLSVYSYIKPQRWWGVVHARCVVYLSIPTSNHNLFKQFEEQFKLFICLFLHQTTTLVYYFSVYQRFISSFAPKKWLLMWIHTAKILKKFQLQRFCGHLFLFFLSPEINNITILLICYTQNTYHSCFWDNRLDSLYMNYLALIRCTMSYIYRVL